MTPISSSIEHERGKYIPWIIAAFFMCFVLLLLSFVWIAFAHKSGEVTEHAYDKGLAYNQVIAKAEAQEKLGWTAAIEADDNSVRLILKDNENNAISDAAVEAWLVRPTEALLDRQFTLKPDGNGIYASPVNWPAKGLWEIHVTARVGNRQYQAEKRMTVR